MLVAIDSGNTNVVFAIFDGETLRAKWRASSAAKSTADEYAVWLTQLMALQGLKPADITGAFSANAVPAAASNPPPSRSAGRRGGTRVTRPFYILGCSKPS